MFQTLCFGYSHAAPPLIGLAWLKTLKGLAPFSLIANGLLIASLVIVVAQSTGEFQYHRVTHNFNMAEFPILFGMVTYAYEGIGLALPVEDSLQRPGDFERLWVGAMVVVTALYAGFAGLCYAAYGGDVAPIITQDMPRNGIASVLRVSLSLAIFFTFPLILTPVIHMLEGRWNKCLAHDSDDVDMRRRLLRALTVLTTALIAAFIPDFSLILSFIGSLPCNLLAFVLPTLFHIKICWRTMSNFERAKDLALCAFGVVAMFVCTYVTVTASGFHKAVGEVELEGGGDGDPTPTPTSTPNP
mmetsp:Transcript_13525/g.32020  ORF Transcript_13525/g.32020 Transcript_13525/m.32020 type:complete len:300 (+) Transcript_13525:34-933(+)